MNDEWLLWLLLTIAVGVGAVLFLALGRIPEIEDEAAGGPPGEDGAGASGARRGGSMASAAAPAGAAAAAPGATPQEPGTVELGVAAHGPGTAGAVAAQSSPASTTVPGDEDPSDTRETP